jgi:hypothetical protein
MHFRFALKATVGHQDAIPSLSANRVGPKQATPSPNVRFSVPIRQSGQGHCKKRWHWSVLN